MESEAPSKPAEEDFNGVSRVWFGIPIFPYLKKKMQSQNVSNCPDNLFESMAGTFSSTQFSSHSTYMFKKGQQISQCEATCGEHCGKQTTHVCLPTICLILDDYQERGMFVCFCCRCCICCRTGLHIQRFRKLAWTDGQASRFAGCDTKSLFSVDERFPKAPTICI